MFNAMLVDLVDLLLLLLELCNVVLFVCDRLFAHLKKKQPIKQQHKNIRCVLKPSTVFERGCVAECTIQQLCASVSLFV